MFLDPIFFGMEVWPIDQPASFAALLPAAAPPQRSGGAPATGRGALGGGTERDEPPDYPWEPSGGRPHPGYDVLVLNDQMNWPENTRALAQKAVEAGRGFVLLHHSLGDNQDWPWWYEEVTGGLLVLNGQNGRKPSTMSRQRRSSTSARPPNIRSCATSTSFSFSQRAGLQEHVAVAEDHSTTSDDSRRQRFHRRMDWRPSDGTRRLHSTGYFDRETHRNLCVPHAHAEFDSVDSRAHLGASRPAQLWEGIDTPEL